MTKTLKQEFSESTQLLPSSLSPPSYRQSCLKAVPLLMVMAAGLIFSIHAMLSKLMPIPPGQYVSTESAFNIPFCMMVCCYSGIDVSPWNIKEKATWFWARVIVGGATAAAKILLVRNMNIGDATAILFSAPIWASLLARIILKEKFTIINFIGVVFGFLGILLIAKPAFIFGYTGDRGDSSLMWAGITLGASFLTAFSYVCIRAAGNEVHPLKFVFYTAVMEFIMGFIINLISGEAMILPPCNWVRAALFLCGMTATLANMLIVKGMSLTSSGPATMMRNWDTVYAYLFQIIFFHHMPDWICLTGAALILGTTVLQAVDTMSNISCGIAF